MFFLVGAVLFCKSVEDFFPNTLGNYNIGSDTWTHQDITEVGILKAVAQYFEDHPRPGSNIKPGNLTGIPDADITARKLFSVYYDGKVSEKEFQKAIDSVVKENNNVWFEHGSEAVWHFNGEAIQEANTRLIQLRRTAIQLLKKTNPQIDAGRQMVGQYLHILQTFYSNTNWVDMFGDNAYYDLESLTQVRQFQENADVLSFLEGITVDGGGDCPEYAMDGIMKARQACLPHSVPYVFTDADAKDPEKYSVVSLAHKKDVKISFLLTGTCSNRRKRIDKDTSSPVLFCASLTSATNPCWTLVHVVVTTGQLLRKYGTKVLGCIQYPHPKEH